MEKPFKTYDELLDFLEEKKELIIPDRDNARKALAKESYYSLINGYKDIFKDKTTGFYKKDVCFDDIYNLYKFDRDLRSIFLKYILMAEKGVKTSLAYHFSELYGENQKEYCDFKNYDVTPKNNAAVQKLISVFQRNLSGKTDYIYINHYLSSHGNVPLWIMVQAITLGQFAHFFDYLKGTAPIRVCKDYHDISRNQMHSFLSVMTKHRNVCAHGDRFYNYRTKDSIADTLIHEKLHIRQVNGRYSNGKNDLFSAVIILKYLLDKCDYKDFQKDLLRCLKKYKPSKEIVDLMGFPDNWKQIIRYSL